MENLKVLTLGLAVFMVAIHAGLLFTPALWREGFQRFPRSRWSGRILSVIAIAWAGWILKDMPLGRFEILKTGLIPLCVLMVILVWVYMDELLAPRAMGAILLLYPAPLLAAARLHDSPWRVLAAGLAYVLIVKGMLLLLSPYLFRRFSEFALSQNRLCRIAGGAGLAFDLFLVLVALMFY